VHPQPEQESIYRTVFAGQVRFGGVFKRSLRATTKKRSSAFLVRKSAKSSPQTKSWYVISIQLDDIRAKNVSSEPVNSSVGPNGLILFTVSIQVVCTRMQHSSVSCRPRWECPAPMYCSLRKSLDPPSVLLRHFSCSICHKVFLIKRNKVRRSV